MLETYLRFDGAEAALDVLGVDTEEGRIIPPDAEIDGQYCSIDVLFGTGQIVRLIDIEGLEAVTEVLPGYHVNVSSGGPLPSLAAFEITPAQPACVFA